MKIDTHQHFWRYQSDEFPWISESMPILRQDRMPQDSQSANQACGVDAVVAVQARGVVQETDFLMELAARESRILGVVGWVDLASDKLNEQLDRWAGKSALRGFRHILQDEPDIATLIESPAFNRGVSMLQKRQLVYDVLVFGHQLPVAMDFCRRHDNHWLVLDHVGKPAVRNWSRDAQVEKDWSARIRELAAMPHVMCKLSGLVTEADWQGNQGLQPADQRVIHACFDLALDAFGPERIMFGSDWPVCELVTDYSSVHSIAQNWASASLGESGQQAFWAGNAVRCYDLHTPMGEPVI
ncbi:MAG TPA: amidohydrolase family protein [Burkholderiaceae bacterium]|nr:amidohydrolase family protein [Burkholderiaceae bacterium]